MGKRVAELEGAELDYWVARAEGDPAIFEHGVCKHLYDDEHGTWNENWHPSIDWSQGGAIIERERLLLAPVMGGEWVCEWCGGDDVPTGEQYGPTPLVAAMRAFVASKFGPEVPDGDPE